MSPNYLNVSTFKCFQVPGFSRPPSLAELAAAKQKTGSAGASLELMVSSGPSYCPPSALPRALVGSDKLQQHSIESSVVTEGHYDASFETEVEVFVIKVTLKHLIIRIRRHRSMWTRRTMSTLMIESRPLGVMATST